MSEGLKKLIEEKEKQQNKANQRIETWTQSVANLYSNIKVWLSEFPSIQIHEEHNSTVHNRYEPGKLRIKIVNSELELLPENQWTTKCMGSVYIQSRKGRRRLCLKSLDVWQFDGKKNVNFGSPIIKLPESSVSALDTAILDKDTFLKVLEELI